MKRIISIKAPSSQGITIAHIIHDDRQTGEYLLAITRKKYNKYNQI